MNIKEESKQKYDLKIKSVGTIIFSIYLHINDIKLTL